MSCMKILCTANQSWSMYNFRADIIQEFLNSGNEVIIVAPADGSSKKFEEMGCQCIDLRIDPKGLNPFKDIRLLLDLYRIYRQTRPDIVFQYTIKPVIYGSIITRLLRIPTANMITGLGKAFLKENWLKKCVLLMYKISQKKVNKIIFLNKDNEDCFYKNGITSGHQAITIPGEGINLTHFTVEPYPHNTNEIIFLLIARLLPEKGIREFIEAATIIKEKCPHVKFQLLGETSEEISIEILRQWDKNNCVEYLGFKNDVRAYIKQAHCIVLPTYYGEGVPRSLLEACAMGRPIITTHISGCKELVQDEINGYLCTPRSLSSLVEKIEKMSQKTYKQREKMANNAYNIVSKTYTIQRTIESYKDIINSMKN